MTNHHYDQISAPHADRDASETPAAPNMGPTKGGDVTGPQNGAQREARYVEALIDNYTDDQLIARAIMALADAEVAAAVEAATADLHESAAFALTRATESGVRFAARAKKAEAEVARLTDTIARVEAAAKEMRDWQQALLNERPLGSVTLSYANCTGMDARLIESALAEPQDGGQS